MSIRTSRSSKRLIAAAVAVAVTASTFAISSTAGATIYQPVSERIGGADRFATAALVALELDDVAGVTDVIIVNGRNFPDALAAASLARQEDAAILLVEQDSIPAATGVVLSTLAPTDIHIVGGTSAVSAAVATELATYVAAATNVKRVSGGDRYATALEVAGATIANASAPEVIIATGQNFADAMTASVLSHRTGFPILLSDGAALSDGIVKFLAEKNIVKAHLIGGESVVPASVATQLTNSLGVDVARHGGADRFATATAVAAVLVSIDSDFGEGIVLANGRTFADALTAAPLAAAVEAPILLVEANSIPAATAKWHVDNASTVTNIWAVGGTSAVSASVLTGAAAAAAQPRPAVTGAALTVTHTAAILNLVDGAGAPANVVKLTATATGDSRGVFGNDWTVDVVEDNTKTAVSVAVNATTKKITLTGNAGLTAAKLTATNVVAAWTASAEASALFTATADAGAGTKEIAAAANIAITTGATDVTVAVTFSVAINDSAVGVNAFDVFPSNINSATAILAGASAADTWATDKKSVSLKWSGVSKTSIPVAGSAQFRINVTADDLTTATGGFVSGSTVARITIVAS